MTVLQIAVLVKTLNLEAAVVTKKFVACGDIHIVTAERDAAQPPVRAATLEVYLARVPVDPLLDFLFLKIDCIYASVALALLTAAYDGCCDELW